ncbi:MerR family transcriptional regulator [bacterium]|nr:MerR family transcriptional regulator [bacterium]
MDYDFKNWLKDRAPKGRLDQLAPVIGISAAAKLTKLSDSALRKYEATGLIIYHRTAGGSRMLCIEDLERIRIIQHLIKKKGLNLEGILRLWALLPCWEFRKCDEQTLESCPAAKDSDRPCWVVLREAKGCEGVDCRTCEVYRFGAYCTEDLKSLVHGLQGR